MNTLGKEKDTVFVTPNKSAAMERKIQQRRQRNGQVKRKSRDRVSLSGSQQSETSGVGEEMCV